MNKVSVLSPQEKPEPLGSLVASAKRIRETNRFTGRRNDETKQDDWQDEAWDLYDMVGELRFIVTTLAGRLGQAKLYVGKQDDTGDQRPEPIEDEEINNLVKSIGKSRSGQSQILTRLAINLSIPGEGWIVGLPPTDDDDDRLSLDEVWADEIDWYMLSVSEVSSMGDGKVKLIIEGDSLEYDPEDIYLIRVWEPHPRRMYEADSPTRAALPILKELVGLTMHISAQVDSRLAGAGVLVVPQSAQRSLRQSAGVDEDEDVDVFTEGLLEAMMTPIGDRASASAVVPMVVTVPDDAADKFQHISFSTNLDAEARNLRDEAIRRLAMSLDAPPELLLGTAGMNHWGGWLVQEETVSSHIEPPLALICDALTTQFLWPVLEERGHEDFQDYVIWYDVSHLITRPTIGQDAMQLHDRNALSDEALRRSMGFDDTDAPTAMSDDPAVSMVVDMTTANPALLTNPGTKVLLESMRALIRGEGWEPEPEPVPEGLEQETDDADESEEEDEADEAGDTDEEPPSNPVAPPRTVGEPSL